LLACGTLVTRQDPLTRNPCAALCNLASCAASQGGSEPARPVPLWESGWVFRRAEPEPRGDGRLLSAWSCVWIDRARPRSAATADQPRSSIPCWSSIARRQGSVAGRTPRTVPGENLLGLALCRCCIQPSRDVVPPTCTLGVAGLQSCLAAPLLGMSRTLVGVRRRERCWSSAQLAHSCDSLALNLGGGGCCVGRPTPSASGATSVTSDRSISRVRSSLQGGANRYTRSRFRSFSGQADALLKRKHQREGDPPGP